MTPGLQIFYLLVIAIPIACVSWTVTHEEIFREPRDFCVRNSQDSRWMLRRKFFYIFTCEYCFSHYVTAIFLLITKFQLLYEGWRGFLVAGFSLVWIANIYMGLYSLIRLDIKKEKIEIKQKAPEENSTTSK